MSRFIDMTGKRFGRWVVIKRGKTDKHNNTRWICECSCGEVRSVRADDLRSGKSISCGCYSNDRKLKHGEAKINNGRPTNQYQCWGDMKARCLNPNHKYYKNYGERGIEICDRWINSYAIFLADMGRCPKGLTLDRIDNDGDYEPGNCRWATRKEQAYNTRANVWIEVDGERMILKEWLKKLKINSGHWHYWDKKKMPRMDILKHFMVLRSYKCAGQKTI